MATPSIKLEYAGGLEFVFGKYSFLLFAFLQNKPFEGVLRLFLLILLWQLGSPSLPLETS